MPQETLKQIQDKLAQIQTTASGLPAGTDVSQASQSLGQITQQVRDMSPIPMDQAEATPPMFEPSPPPEDYSLKAQVEQKRQSLEEIHRAELERVNKQLEEARRKEAEYLATQKGVLDQADPLTQPFRQNIETAERERLKIEENFFANQALTNELDRLLTESIEMTRKLQTQRVPGLAGLQQSTRMVKAQENVQGRIAVIEAVMSARNNQIGVAQGFIDRTISNIQADRNDRLNYLNTLFNFYETSRNEEGNKIFNLTKEQKEIFDRQRQLIEQDLQRAEAIADRVKSLISENPLMASEAGISLSDTEDEINSKLAEWQYKEEVRTMRNVAEENGMRTLSSQEVSSYDPSRVFTTLDSRGREMKFLIPEQWEKAMVDNSLYRVNSNTGEAELMVRGTSPLESILLKGSMSGSMSAGNASEMAPILGTLGLDQSQIQILSTLNLSPVEMTNVAGIYTGISRPMTTGELRSVSGGKQKAGLAALGYDAIQAEADYLAMINTIRNLTSEKTDTLRRAIIALEGSTQQAERIYSEWQATGIPGGFSNVNKLALEVMARLPGNAGVQARTLISHVEDMAAELAIIYRGGGQATDDALEQAKKSLDGSWNQDQFDEALRLIRQNLQIRKNSINQAALQALEGGNIYSGVLPGTTDSEQSLDDIFKESGVTFDVEPAGFSNTWKMFEKFFKR